MSESNAIWDMLNTGASSSSQSEQIVEEEVTESKNSNLHKAKSAKNDEFYTQLSDIENELSHYAAQFKGKTILCPCDNPRRSKFWEYLHRNLTEFDIEKIIFTFTDAKLGPKHDNDSYAFCYSQSTRKSAIQKKREELENRYKGNRSYTKEERQTLIEDELAAYNPDYDFSVGTIASLKPDSAYGIENGYLVGDFRSKDVRDLMTKCDIVITNPPFSLFREFVACLVELNKKFLIIGDKNAITYKDIFPLIRDNKLWIGERPFSGGMWFITPEGVSTKTDKVVNGVKLSNVATCWFTNMDNSRKHNPLILTEKYAGNEKLYPKYDNYDAIEVSKTKDIPCDYSGVMGVPITFLDKYCPEQFDIVAFRKCDDDSVKAFSRAEEREFNNTFVSKYDIDCRDDKERRRRNQWEEYLRQNNNQAEIEPIDFFYPNSITNRAAGTMNGLLEGKETYRRILIRRKVKDNAVS